MSNELIGFQGNGAGKAAANKTPVDERQWLYHPDHEARIFKGAKDIEAALKAGWQDTPFPVEKTEPASPDDRITELETQLADESKAKASAESKNAELQASNDKMTAKVKELETQLAEAKKGKK